MTTPLYTAENILFITGRLAEPLVHDTVKPLSEKLGFSYQIQQIGVQVAALLHVDLLLNRLQIPTGITKVILPGWVQGDINRLTEHFKIPFELGPRSIVDLPTYFGSEATPPDLTQFSIDIIAEINHAPRLSLGELLQLALLYQSQGADLIDLGCIPGETWLNVGDAVKLLKDHGLTLSIDSFNRAEVEPAVKFGAELILSCNSSNRDWCVDLPAESVIIPDLPHEWERMDETINLFLQKGHNFRIDPILEPIGFGFGASLVRYHLAHKRWPDFPQMMGIGNITELTQADSTGINMLLVSLAQEWNSTSLLTTQVAPWTQNCIREIALARRLSHFSLKNKRLPKKLGEHLVLLSSATKQHLGENYIHQLATQIKDPNFRIFAEEELLHLINREGHFTGTDPFELFMQASEKNNITPDHAFYLGYEMAKAVTSLTLNKAYRQDQALNWGFLTRPEDSHRHD
jgi:dihydropteroate synthase-like protein